MWASTLPDAMSRLVTGFRGELAEHVVKDGATVSSATLAETVTVGFTDPDEETAAEWSAEIEGVAVQPQREKYSIRCKIEVVKGSGDQIAARTRVFELFAIVIGVVAADHTLGKLLLSAQVGQGTYAEPQSSKGAVGKMTFSVDCDGYMKPV